jgi:hypothetical protein
MKAQGVLDFLARMHYSTETNILFEKTTHSYLELYPSRDASYPLGLSSTGLKLYPVSMPVNIS